MNQFAPLFNCAGDKKMHFTKYAHELTGTMFRKKRLKMHVIVTTQDT